ncbi:MAG: ABC transporter permease [Anaerolineae bacterium]|nr:ABC transporter permease [Anaerolineae bacterium]
MLVIFENVRNAVISLLSNKLRALLTMLGISIGVAAVIVLVSLGQAVQDYIAAQFLGIGANLAFVYSSTNAPQTSGPPSANRTSINFSTLTNNDVAALADPFNVPDAKYVVPQISFRRLTDFERAQARARIIASSELYFTIRNRTLAVGRAFDQEEVRTQARVAVIGQTTMTQLFPDGTLPVGETIRIDGIPFRVIGVLNKYGGASFQDEDDAVIIPITTAQSRLQNLRNLSGAKAVSQILMQAQDETSLDAMVEQATETLRRVRNIDFRDADDFEIITQKDLIESFGQITNLLTIFLAIIAGISLLVGGIGIMNIMLVTVTERTREIGLRKAVGARAGDVLFQFLIEATVLSLVGGVAGLTVAVLATTILSAVLPELDATVRLGSVLLAVGISAGIGIFFGLYPASRASSMNPIEALRYE